MVKDKNFEISLPLKDGKGKCCVCVTPNKIYGNFTGLELIEKYARKTTIEEARREKRRIYKRDWWQKESLTGITNKDRRTLTRVGNELNDVEFIQHLVKIKAITDDKERQAYINSLKGLDNDKFCTRNEGKLLKYKKVIVETEEESEEDILSECEN